MLNESLLLLVVLLGISGYYFISKLSTPLLIKRLILFTYRVIAGSIFIYLAVKIILGDDAWSEFFKVVFN